MQKCVSRQSSHSQRDEELQKALVEQLAHKGDNRNAQQPHEGDNQDSHKTVEPCWKERARCMFSDMKKKKKKKKGTSYFISFFELIILFVLSSVFELWRQTFVDNFLANLDIWQSLASTISC